MSSFPLDQVAEEMKAGIEYRADLVAEARELADQHRKEARVYTRNAEGFEDAELLVLADASYEAASFHRHTATVLTNLAEVVA